ncbi:hypothetical protein EV702DRAFT_1051527 [Suillus placidus]|uniref:CxC1-like cysteine cluster associated with KDZ transposases domain-containing protein n=2 Tax=Suillus placidus TaxID=48579 RepID=A0A9P7CVU1_9AGAM|nr:hypothetical protein EV702DRAFT_1051527 [Suillus placidus]
MPAHVLPGGKQSQRLEAAASSRRAQFQEMSAEDREMVESMMVDYGMDVDALPYTVPPGDEGLDMSHAGGEYEAFEELAHEVAGISGCRYVDPRTRTDRIESESHHWDVQIDLLVEAYLDYRHRNSGDGMPQVNGMPPSPSDYACSTCFAGRKLSSLIYLDEAVLCLNRSPTTIVISLRTLAAYHQIHQIPYRPYLMTQLSAAFDLSSADTPNWRLLNTCPACFYKLEDEPDLGFNWLISMDGNNSLKRWDPATYGKNPRLDSHKVRSDFWIDPDTVDKFSGEVRAHAAMPDEGDTLNDETVETNPAPFSCTDRWKNAGPEIQKKMFSIFDESGIFIASCRHRFVLLACDMIRSGELIRAKYPLAIVDKLLATYGKGGACAYDIGSPRAHQLGFRLMVGAFHGHAHNRKCQLDWHPMYIPGTGHSEGEGCEHIFSASNALARGTRHASKFHRHQNIEQHFAFWNDDKYAALSGFMWNHYREALKSIQMLTVELSAIKAELNITDDDFPQYLLQERAYLDSLKQPPARDKISIRYVEDRMEFSTQLANNALTEIAAGSLEQINKALAQARIRVDSSYAKLQHAEVLVAHIESQLAVEARWEIGGNEYNQFKMEAQSWQLSKVSLSGTGYKLRQQIGKALQRCSEAIRNSINRYNIQAIALNPPCPKISWKDIADYSFLGEFDLLCHSRNDIRTDDWAKPAHREATTKYFKLCCAREELTRLNVEIRRLRTTIHSEQVQTTAVIEDLCLSDPKLADELQRRWHSRAAINAVHLYRLDHIECLPGFSGVRGVGIRVQLASTTPDIPVPHSIDDISTIIGSDYTDIEAIDREEHQMITEDMADFFHSIVD